MKSRLWFLNKKMKMSSRRNIFPSPKRGATVRGNTIFYNSRNMVVTYTPCVVSRGLLSLHLGTTITQLTELLSTTYMTTPIGL